MTRVEDFMLTICLQIAALGVGCMLAWRAGHPLTLKDRKALYAIPLFFLFMSAWSALELLFPHFFGMSKYLATQWQVDTHMGDCLLLLIAAGISMVYAKVAPALFEAGAHHHPRTPLSPALMHARRKARGKSLRRMAPLLVLGAGTGLIAGVTGFQTEDGALFVEALFGTVIWSCAIVFISDWLALRKLNLTPVDN